MATQSGEQTPCTEVYVYEIPPEKIQDFLAIKDRLIEEAHTLPGLQRSATFQSEADPGLFIDRMQWESVEAAKRGQTLFRDLPTSSEFMALMSGPPRLGGRFRLVAGQ